MKEKSVDMNVDQEKLEIIKWVTGLKDKTALERLRLMKANPKKSDWWNEVAEEEKSAIEKGLDDIKAGRIKPHKDAKRLYEKWL